MEENKKNIPTEALSSSAKRRRRRHRSGAAKDVAVQEGAKASTQVGVAGTREALGSYSGAAAVGASSAAAGGANAGKTLSEGTAQPQAAFGKSSSPRAAQGERGQARTRQSGQGAAGKGARSASSAFSANGGAGREGLPAGRSGAGRDSSPLTKFGAGREESVASKGRAAAPGRAVEEDPGLLLISRKPPVQKFTSFEEYMKSHGGFSVPEGDNEK